AASERTQGTVAPENELTVLEGERDVGHASRQVGGLRRISSPYGGRGTVCADRMTTPSAEGGSATRKPTPARDARERIRQRRDRVRLLRRAGDAGGSVTASSA